MTESAVRPFDADADGKVRATFSGLTRNPADFIAFLRRARS